MTVPYSQAPSSSYLQGVGSAEVTEAVHKALADLTTQIAELTEQALSDAEIQAVLTRLKLDRDLLWKRLLTTDPGMSGTTSPEVARIEQALRAVTVAGGSREVNSSGKPAMPRVAPAYLAILVAWTVMASATVTVLQLWMGSLTLPGSALPWSAGICALS